jgi:hypothetical protein
MASHKLMHTHQHRLSCRCVIYELRQLDMYPLVERHAYTTNTRREDNRIIRLSDILPPLPQIVLGYAIMSLYVLS